MKNKFVPEPKFATSLIHVGDAEYEFSIDLSLIFFVEANPFHGFETENANDHIKKLVLMVLCFLLKKNSTLLLG